MKTVHRLMFLGGTLAILAAPADAQQPQVLGATRVTLVAGIAPTQGGRTEVIRRSGRSARNIVIVSTDANADDLAGALALVNALRLTYGDASSTAFRARPDIVRHGPKWQESEYRKWLQDQLVRLRKAKEAQLDELGLVRAVQITLPPPPANATTRANGS